jgi:hypothetical protein
MKITGITCVAAALTCIVLAGCVQDQTVARRSVTTIRTDPRPSEDTNLIPPAVPAPESTAVIRRERKPADDD